MVCAPAVEIRPGGAAARRLFGAFRREASSGRCGIAVFTSATGVAVARAWSRDRLAHLLAKCRVVAIGGATAAALKLKKTEVPPDQTSAGLVEYLKDSSSGKRVWLLRSDKGDPVLVTGLRAAGASVDEVALYRVAAPLKKGRLRNLIRKLCQGDVDAILFTSRMGVLNFFGEAEAIGLHSETVAGMRVIVVGAIGGPTASALSEAGMRNVVTPGETDFDALARAVDRALSARVAARAQRARRRRAARRRGP